MIKENKDLISFHPGSKKNGKVILARIEVHSRAQVEQNILPRYFNHNSFASLRRQLNYFSFTRLGKGRQKGASYCNEGVIVMDDILKLKRRLHAIASCAADTSSGPPSELAPTGTSSNSVAARTLSTPEPSTSGKKHLRSVSISSDESFNSNNDTTDVELVLRPLKKKPRRLLSTMAPLDHLEQDNDSSSLMVGPTARYKISNRSTTVVLDLTRPTAATEQLYRGKKRLWTVPPTTGTRARHLPMSSSSSLSTGDEEDVLAGCQALLCFSRGPSPGGLVV